MRWSEAEIVDLSVREELLDASGLRKGRILDVGMGGCACMARLLVQHGFDVVGVDRSADAVREARKEGRGSFKTRRVDARQLPFGDGEFDAVVAFRALHHMRDPKQVLAEMFRVCKAGGAIMVAELNADGRRRFFDRVDGGILLRYVEQHLRRCGERTRRIESTHDILFVCRKRPRTKATSRARARVLHSVPTR